MKKQKNGMYREKATYKGVTYDLTAKTERELMEKIVKRKAAIDDGEYSIHANMTVENWARVWLEEYKRPNVIKQSYDGYKSIINNHIIPYIGKKKVCDLLPVDVQSVLNRQRGKSKSQVIYVRKALTGMLKEAKKNKLTREDLCDGLKNPEWEEGGTRAFTDEEIQLLFKACKKHKKGLFPKIMYYCGLRPGEVAALETKRDIDLNAKIIHVRNAVEAGFTRNLKGPKTESGVRDVPIPDELIPELTEAVKSAGKYLFVTEQGRLMAHSNVISMWRSILHLMDIEAGATLKGHQVIKSAIGRIEELPNGNKRVVYHLKLYWLRHTYCTNLQRAGIPINIAKDLMGHADTKMVERIYTHFTDDQFEATRQKLNDFASAKKG